MKYSLNNTKDTYWLFSSDY